MHGRVDFRCFWYSAQVKVGGKTQQSAPSRWRGCLVPCCALGYEKRHRKGAVYTSYVLLFVGLLFSLLTSTVIIVVFVV